MKQFRENKTLVKISKFTVVGVPSSIFQNAGWSVLSVYRIFGYLIERLNAHVSFIRMVRNPLQLLQLVSSMFITNLFLYPSL